MQQKDPDLGNMMDLIDSENVSINKQYVIKNGILCYKSDNARILFVVQKNIVQAAHDDNGHAGIEKTTRKILEAYYFPRQVNYAHVTKVHM